MEVKHRFNKNANDRCVYYSDVCLVCVCVCPRSLIPAIRDARCNNKAGLLAVIVSDGAYLQLSEPSVELGAAVRVLTPFQPPSD